MATAKKAAATPEADAKVEVTVETVEAKPSKLSSIRENVLDRASDARATVTSGLDTARGVSSQTSGAAVDFGKAYYAGVSTLGRTLFGFGKEFYGEVTTHAQKTMSAKSVREVAELQAAYIQTRIETSAAHGKEFIDVATVEAEKTMKPVIELLDGKRAA
ncbi:MAG: phasin family protein [Pseudomonadota bacterium]